MSGYEEQLHARAEMLDETGELAAAVTAILAGASGAGVDPHAITGLRAAIAALDPASGPPGYQAGSRADRHPGSGYGSDSEFLEAVSDAEDQIRDWLRDAEQLQDQVTAAAEQGTRPTWTARDGTWNAARQALAAAYAMPTKNACAGCHPAKAAAIAAAEAAIADAERTHHRRHPAHRHLRGHRRDPGPARPAAPGRPAGAPPGAARPRRGLRADLPVHPPRRENAALRPVDRGSRTGLNKPQHRRDAPSRSSNDAASRPPRAARRAAHLTRSPPPPGARNTDVPGWRPRAGTARRSRSLMTAVATAGRLPGALTAVGASRACIAPTTPAATARADHLTAAAERRYPRRRRRRLAYRHLLMPIRTRRLTPARAPPIPSRTGDRSPCPLETPP